MRPAAKWNLAVAVVQGILFISALVLFVLVLVGEMDAGEFSMYTGEYLGPEQQCRTLVTLEPVMLIGLLALFSAVTCGFHAWYASGSKVYYRAVKRGNNSYRWLEYSITATIMALVLALTSGVYELSAQILVGVSVAAAMACGDIVERALRMRKDTQTVIVATIVGWWLVFGALGVVSKSFFESVLAEDADAPWFVYLVFIGLVLFFASFGFIQLADVVRFIAGKPIPAPLLELAYSVASVVSKTFLVVVLLVGFLARNKADNQMERDTKIKLTE